jgi:tetratricopeptide (TPR) repeat protein
MPLTGGGMPGTNNPEDREPTPQELRERLIKDTAFQIASRLVNTTEDVNVFLARGAGLDEADTLMEQKLYTRALESLETTPPSSQPGDDAYRLYDLGVVNEALGYQAEDVGKARKYLQEAAIDYGKAIDAKPAEKMFLEPQNRIDTALAHYKVLGDQMASRQAANKAAVAAAAGPDVLTNADVISMVQAKLDQANIVDTIQHSAAKFDMSVKGQIELSKGGVNGQIIAAMKAKARGQ